MIVRNMRWGYDGGGMACGPVEGTYIAELMVTAEDRHNYFITCSQLCEFCKVEISEVSLFDLEMELMGRDVDFDYELEKIQKLPIETYESEVNYTFDDSGKISVGGFERYDDQSMFTSRFAQGIRLGLMALDVYCSAETEDNAPTAPFIGKYIGKDINGIEFGENV